MAETAETKKVINPRVEIDTSPPFESVKEAVDRFGGSGPWIPQHLLRYAAAAASAHHEDEVFDVGKVEEHAAQLERDLIMKEQETLSILKELEAAKHFVEGLKVNLISNPSSPFMASPNLNLGNHNDENSTEPFSFLSPGLMFMELNRAKLNLNKTSGDLAVIQASVESLNKKMRRDKLLLENRTQMQNPNSEGVLSLEQNHHHRISKPQIVVPLDGSAHPVAICQDNPKQVNFEADQFKKMTEASRYEVIKAMTEIERTKNSIKMAEMRLNAAKKMEEAAKAVEAIAVAEQRDLLSGSENSLDTFIHKQQDGITLSFEEYRALTRKAQQADDMCKTKFIDDNALRRAEDARRLEVPILEKFEEIDGENNSSKYKFRNSHPGHRNPPVVAKDKPGFRTTTSIGDILGRKMMVHDDVMVGRHVEDHDHSERQHISLSQMLREQSRVIFHHPSKQTAEGNVEKQYFVQRKKFGFIQVPLPTRQSKKKTQSLNTR